MKKLMKWTVIIFLVELILMCFHAFTLDKFNDIVLRRAPAGADCGKISQAGFLSKIGEKIHNVEIS